MRSRRILILAAVLAVGWSAAAHGDVVSDYLDWKAEVGASSGQDLADEVWLDLIIDPAGPGTWEVRATVTGVGGGEPETAGLGDFILDVTGDGGAVVTSSRCDAVEFEPADAPGYMAGFCVMRDDGDLGWGIIAIQPVDYPPPNDPFFDRLVIQGAGIEGGLDTSTSGPVSWQREFLVASGTYAGEGYLTALNPTVQGQEIGWFVLEKTDGPQGPRWYGPTWDAQPWAHTVHSDTEYAPEPAALLLFAAGAAFLLRRRSR